MKKLFTMCLLACVAAGANAQDKTTEKNVPVFTTVKENPITSIKDQNRSGTCWAYSTLSFLESEILRSTGKTYNLCEMFIANKDYMDRAVLTVRMHGDSQFSQGGSFSDVVTIMKNHGIVVGGCDLKEAFYSLESIQAYCKTYLCAKLLGKVKALNKKQIKEIDNLKH